MRIKRMAGLGLASGALVLSGAIAAVADNSTGTSSDSEPTTSSSTATTAPGDDRPDRGDRVRHMAVNGEELSDAQRECMEENGAAPPGKPGERPTREDMEAHRTTMEAAMDECGIEHPTGPTRAGKPGEHGGPGDGPHHVMVVGGEELTDEQRACMEENAPPPAFEPGEHPSREDMSGHREQIEAAMDECGISRPEVREGDAGGEGGFAFRSERGGPGGASGGGELSVTQPDGVEYGFAESGPAEAVPSNA